jgi:hypothetical protein
MRPRILYAVAAAFACLAAARPGLGAPADVSAESRSEAGLNRAFFHLPQGTIRVNYPDDAAAGDTISGTVYVEPSGSNQQQQDHNGAELSGYVVEMPGRKVPVSSTRFLWNVPAMVPGGAVPIVLRDRSNHAVTECSLPVHPGPLPPAAGPIDLPVGAQAGNLVSAWGPFDPNSETAITVGGKTAPLIAESPRKVIFQVPPDVAGETQIEVRNGGLSARGPFRSLRLAVSATRKSMPSGTTTTMTVVVSGLQGLEEPASLLLVNHEPGVVNLSGGPVQQITISPADVQSGGTFRLTRTLTGEHGGGYNLTVLASLPPASQLPLQRLAARTLDSWSRSSRVEIAPEAQSMILAGIAEARPELDTLFREQLVFLAEPSSLLDWLVRDYCFDLRDRKLGAPSAGELHPPRPAFALAFAGFTVPAADSGASVSLQSADVSHFSFLQYLADFLARHAPSRPLGSLLVTSQPDKQLITIDQATGPDYFTARMFVVSVGDHTVKVADCQERITVNPNQQATLNCPKS